MSRAIDKIKEEWLTQDELAFLFGVDIKRIRDMRSKGTLGIKYAKLSSKGYYFHVEDVLDYMEQLRRSDQD